MAERPRPRAPTPRECRLCGADITGRRAFVVAASPAVGGGRVQDWVVCQACYLDLSPDEVTE